MEMREIRAFVNLGAQYFQYMQDTKVFYLVTSHSACTTPGRNINKHKTILIIRSLPAPFFRNTATGGRKIANMINTILLSVCYPLYLEAVKDQLTCYTALSKN